MGKQASMVPGGKILIMLCNVSKSAMIFWPGNTV